MFDISWSELLILGLVTLIFVGPKELPRFLGQLGKYAGVVRRQANEFRTVFEQAMREAEMDQIQKEVRSISDGVKASLDEATRSVENAKAAASVEAVTPPAEQKILAERAASSGEGVWADDTGSVNAEPEASPKAEAPEGAPESHQPPPETTTRPA
jgi:sec-independent protein translocase protein TatB